MRVPRLIESSLQISLLNDEILTGKIDIDTPYSLESRARSAAFQAERRNL